MHDALQYTLMVEVGDLLAQYEVFQQGRSARADAQRILVVTDWDALVGRKCGMGAAGQFVQLVTIAA